MNPDDLILISVDDHIAEPANMFEAHVPKKYKEHAPKVVTDENGREQWYYGKLPGRNLGLNAVAGKPREHYNIDASRYDEMRPGCYNVHERVRDMNAGGQLAGLNFPNWTGFSGQVLNEGPDPDLNDIMIKAYNDWHIDEWVGAYPDRFIPCGILPLFDIDRAVAEVKRLADKGCHAVTFSENPAMLGMPSIHSGAWDPLFAACSDLNTVLCCHLGSSSRSMGASADAPPSVPMTLSSALTISTLVELVWAEFWDRFPDLKFSLTEGDIGWIPYFMWRSEHVQDRHSGWTKHEFGIDGSPNGVFRKHILCCFINDRIGVKLLDEFNVDNLCWESDYPHSDGTWPQSPEYVAKLLGHLPEDIVAKITHQNAMRHYQFDPFAHRPPEKCTAAALRAESPDVDVVTHVGRPADERDAEFWRRIQTGGWKRE
ncbi:MAG: amidohydrolase [Acidimicrobiia bacterium]|nr:amidohydrolase [Acidimicrobiia bacterium]MYB10381.1 amidohydrolase [Acidimicrobiia bacterium]MYB74330.1 amidohydrolase [Acidimicrobiia bacterium]MYG58938.1 amidohydrolase [Acidimicrobiia bacterium]MYH99147.1 amidohydrolase [Acidimicrobiia bacterium]